MLSLVAAADGKLRLRGLPHPLGPLGLKVPYQKGTVSKIPDQALPSVVLETSK